MKTRQAKKIMGQVDRGRPLRVWKCSTLADAMTGCHTKRTGEPWEETWDIKRDCVSFIMDASATLNATPFRGYHPGEVRLAGIRGGVIRMTLRFHPREDWRKMLAGVGSEVLYFAVYPCCDILGKLHASDARRVA